MPNLNQSLIKNQILVKKKKTQANGALSSLFLPNLSCNQFNLLSQSGKNRKTLESFIFKIYASW